MNYNSIFFIQIIYTIHKKQIKMHFLVLLSIIYD
jgi:hypothetical protein